MSNEESMTRPVPSHERCDYVGDTDLVDADGAIWWCPRCARLFWKESK